MSVCYGAGLIAVGTTAGTVRVYDIREAVTTVKAVDEGKDPYIYANKLIFTSNPPLLLYRGRFFE